jgi:hypothetical protein
MWQTRPTLGEARGRRSVLGTEQPDRMLTGQLFGPGGNTTLEYWNDGRRIRAAWKAPKRKRPCRSRALPVDRFVLRRVAFAWFPAHAQLCRSSASCSPGHEEDVLYTTAVVGSCCACAKKAPAHTAIEGAYKVKEGDLVVISFLSDEREPFPRHHVLLVDQEGMTDLTVPSFGSSILSSLRAN